MAILLLTAELPRLELPLLKATVPVATPLNCPDTFAVKVTDCPAFAGFSEEVRAVEELALLTVWFTAAEVLEAKAESPPYTAVMESVPTGRAIVVRLAVPLVSCAVPSEVAPLMNVTFSPFAGVPPLEDTEAVKVTGSW